MIRTGCVCQHCGHAFYADLIVPDHVWEKITPKTSEPGAGLLCPSCIMHRIQSRGIWTAGQVFDVDSIVELIIE